MVTQEVMLMLFGSSAGGGIVTLLLKFLLDLRKAKAAERQSDAKEANNVIARYVKEIESLRNQHKQDYEELKREHRTCLAESAEMREEIGRLQAKVELLTKQLRELKEHGCTIKECGLRRLPE